jgi:hypothetical protein
MMATTTLMARIISWQRLGWQRVVADSREGERAMISFAQMNINIINNMD